MEFIFRQIAATSPLGSAIILGCSLLCGVIIALVYRAGAYRPSKFMIITAIIMPSVVQMVIMLVNGSVGAGVAVAGAFSLVRFRSIPGSSRDICILFLAMASGIAMGMGYAAYGVIFTLIISAVVFISEKIIPSEQTKNSRILRIAIPEDTDYNGLFDDIFKEYAKHISLQNVRSVKMGTMFELQYIITMKDMSREKEMLDKIRCRNGNLTVGIGVIPASNEL